MKKITVISRILCIAAIAVSVSACSSMSTPKVAELPKPKLEDLLAKASEAKAAGKHRVGVTRPPEHDQIEVVSRPPG